MPNGATSVPYVAPDGGRLMAGVRRRIMILVQWSEYAIGRIYVEGGGTEAAPPVAMFAHLRLSSAHSLSSSPCGESGFPRPGRR